MSNYLSTLKDKLSGVDKAPEADSQAVNTTRSESITRQLTNDLAETEPSLDGFKTTESQLKKNLLMPDVKNQFFLTQTIIKELTDRHGYSKEKCPRFIYENFIQKKYRQITPSMLEGIFGETLVLGGGAKGQKVLDLPRHKKTNEKLTSQLNIEEQAHRFKIWQMEKGISIIPGYNTQLPITKRFSEKVLVRTEIDLFPTPFIDKAGLRLAVIDIKFTGDVNTKMGNYCWGAPEYIDHIQADMTYWLLQDFDMELNLKFNPEKEEVYKKIFENQTILNLIKTENIYFIYFVIGYKKQPLSEQVLFLHREYREANGGLLRQNEWKERARKTIATLREFASKNWEPLESTFCSNCPVSQRNGGYCNKFSELQKI